MFSSKCPKCWDAVCRCGHEWDVYEGWLKKDLERLKAHIEKILLTKKPDSEMEV